MSGVSFARVLAMTTLLLSAASSVRAADPLCSYTASLTPAFGSVTSFVAQSTAQNTSASAVASCQGSLLNVLVILGETPYLRATVSGSTNGYKLRNAAGDTITYSLYAAPSGQYAITPGTAFNYYQQTLLNLLGLLGGTGGTLPMYFVTTPSGPLSAGTYSDSFTIAWSWKICNLGAVVCLGYTSGSGTANVTVSMEVTNSCTVSAAPAINFGSAPAASSFAAVSQSIGVLCTKGLGSYSVGLNGGQNASAGRRQMANGASRLQYDLFKSADGNVWGASGGSAWAAPAAANGVTAQTFAYQARVYTDQATPPVNHYADTVMVTVTW